MIMLVTAIAIAAATPVAAQTANATNPAGSTHTDHGTPAPDRSGKGCCCCDSRVGDSADAPKKMECCEKASGETPAGQHSEHNH